MSCIVISYPWSQAMAFTAAAISAALPRPLRLHPSHAISTLPRSSRLHYPSSAITSPLLRTSTTVPFHRRAKTAIYAILSRDDTAYVPITDIGPANDDKSIYKVTLDLTDMTEYVASYTTPGQSVVTSVPGLRGAYMEIASAPNSGPKFDLLVRPVPGTTAEQLCKLKAGDIAEVGAVTGQGISVQDIKDAKTVLYFAVADGLSPIRALIQSGLTNNVTLYYGARNQESVPLQEELNEWQKSGVNVIKVLLEPVQYPFLRDQDSIIKYPDSTVAVLVGPIEMQQELKKALKNRGVPAEKILTIAQWYPNY